jgi:ABC transporter with metal-binding/Fe-S-binding domain ATP-binding protein
MRLAALFSGGKDSTYAVRLKELAGHEIAYLVTLQSRRDDSYMFHTVNIDLTSFLAEAMEKESIQVPTEGEKELELDDLENALRELDVEGIVTGAIASSYQKNRIDMICDDLGLEHFSPLWGRNTEILLEEMIQAGMDIIIVSVAAMGFDEKWLGRKITKTTIEDLKDLNKKYGVDICGEGGEMETLVLDAPWFKKRLEVIKAKPVWDGTRGSYKIEVAEMRSKPRIT